MSVSPPSLQDTPAAQAASLLCRMGLALLAIAVPLADIGARRAIFVLMPIGAVLVVVAALLDWRRQRLGELQEHLLAPASLVALLLLFWAILSLIWTPFRPEAAVRFSKEIGTVALSLLVCFLLPERTRISNLYLWPIGVGLAAAGTIAIALAGPALLTMAQDGENSTLERGLLAITVLVWPAMAGLALRGRWNSAGAIAVLTAMSAIAVWSSAALLGLLAGALVFALCANHSVRAGRLAASFFVMLLLCAPLLPLALEPLVGKSVIDTDTILGNLQSAARAWAQIVRFEGWRLLTGHGIDSATRGIFGGFLPARTPHGILFEIWFELGALGAVACAVLVTLGFQAFGRQAPVLAPFLVSGFTCFLVIAILGFSLSQLWWVTLAGIAAIACSHVLRGQYLARRPQLDPARTRPVAAQTA